MSTHEHIPDTVCAHLETRLAPFADPDRGHLKECEVENSPATATAAGRQQKLTFLDDLKLLFAALGAGGSVVPLGDNGRTAHLLAQYAASLRDH